MPSEPPVFRSQDLPLIFNASIKNHARITHTGTLNVPLDLRNFLGARALKAYLLSDESGVWLLGSKDSRSLLCFPRAHSNTPSSGLRARF